MTLDFLPRRFTSQITRSLCTAIYADTIHPNTWSRWREWIGVGANRRSYSFYQLCRLAAIARLKQDPNYRYRQLRRSEINALADSAEFQDEIANAIALADSVCVVGKDAVIALKTQGINISTRSLYRVLPGFSVNKVYNLRELVKACR